MKTILSIAGSDPSGGAGIQADVKVFSDFGMRALAAVTAITVQNGVDVTEARALSGALVARQVTAVLDTHEVEALKIGMLGSGAIVKAISSILKERDFRNVVLDPVLSATGGFSLLDDETQLRKLYPFVSVMTPNLDEASRLCARPVRTVKDMKEAALRLHSLGAAAVVVTGGHLKKSAVDILYDGKHFHYFEGERRQSPPLSSHGTGCLFSSALAAGLARGRTLKRAVADAKTYVSKQLDRGR